MRAAAVDDGRPAVRAGRWRPTLRPVRPAGWWLDAVLLAAFVLITIAIGAGWLVGLDRAVFRWSDTHRPAPLYWTARGGNYLAQGTPLTVLCGIVAVLIGARARSWRPLVPVVVAFVLTFGTLTPLKDLTDRPAPHADKTGQGMLVHFGEHGVSYPSGHVVNAIVWYGVLALLLAAWLPVPWRRALRVVPPAIVCLTTVYLGFHWLTDTIAGLTLGLVLDRVMRRLPFETPPRETAPLETGSAEERGDRGTQLG